MYPKRVSLLGLPISLSATKANTVSSMKQILRSSTPGLVTFVNPHAFYLSSIDQGYLNSLWHFDLVLPDGIGVVKALRWLRNEDVERQSFDATSLFDPVLSLLNDGEFSLCLIGGKPSIANLAQKKMESKYPKIQYKGCMDGFQSFDKSVQWALECKCDVILVAMGAPHQETFLLRLKQSGFKGLGITCGGFLDQLSESDSYYPSIVDKMDIRWIYRLFKEPKRLSRRYIVEYRGFVLNVLYRRLLKSLFGQNEVPVIWR